MGEAFHNLTPIYIQLAERINRQIVRQDLKPGDKLPSVREMAVQVGINPNTVQRTYRELELMGIVETRRGQGTFVTENKQVLEKLREMMKEARIESFVREMSEMGYSAEEMMEGLNRYLRRKKGGDEE
jgi:GntR family transcriptional regulator